MTEHRRSGPRPLALHLAISAGASTSSLAALPAASSGSLPWSANARAAGERLRPALAAADPERLAAAVAGQATARLAAFLAGVRAWRRHPWRRPQSAAATAWRRGSSRLLDYGGPGAPVLLVPSLINRAHILDLRPGASLCAWLKGRGWRPLLLDWGPPGATEAGFDLDAYILGRLRPALDAAAATAGGALPVIGYCMGGLLALAAALRRPAQVSRLALLAVPWDFHAGGGRSDSALAGLTALAAHCPQGAPPLPADLVAWPFALLQADLVQAKFRRFAALDPASAEAEAFVALEDWLDDGVALAVPVARDCLAGWYGRNDPAAGRWRVGGRAVEPARLACPAFLALPSRDRIVPPAQAAALARALPAAATIEPKAGHVGMAIGGRARQALWQPLESWLGGG